MKSQQIRNSFLLLLTAFIWGIAFVAQSTGGEVLGPYTFNSIRSFIGALALIPVIKILNTINTKKNIPQKECSRKQLIIAGTLCGTMLCIASNIQQLGLYFGASAGKAGFLTACYILIVPILGLFLKKKCGINVWIGVFLALIGLYLLCINDNSSFTIPDILLLLCALFFSFHILIIDHFSPLVDGVKMSCIQFLICGILTAIPMFIEEVGFTLSSISNWLAKFGSAEVWVPLLYAGIMSCGVAYTLQIIGQEGLNPTVASLLMSLESVFSVIAGFILLGETMGIRELSGCGLLFGAIILAQLPVSKATNQ